MEIRGANGIDKAINSEGTRKDKDGEDPSPTEFPVSWQYTIPRWVFPRENKIKQNKHSI